ncbi:MAG: DUF5683 domain-containing protein [Tannerella sp.]|nr:DUF5683 domain-containing protein [Tannerella sp.]
MSNRCHIIRVSVKVLIISLLLLGFAGSLHAQDTQVDDSLKTAVDSLKFEDSSLQDSVKPHFKPNPKTAYLIAAVFPGVGQVYNRQYWKLPIVYGGFCGFLYAITWNNKNYSDYRRAYFDIVIDNQNDPTGEHPEDWSQSWQDFVPANVNPANYFRNSMFQNNLKSGKDFYRRNRDLSIILSIAFYLICVADAYVDAQMFDFDVSPDISFRFTPEIRPDPLGHSRYYAVNIGITF